MGIITFKKQPETGKKNKCLHIMVVGQFSMQQVIADFLRSAYNDRQPVIECPRISEVLKALGQLEPNVIIVTNYNLGHSLKLKDILDRFPASRVVVMCDSFTIDEVKLFGTHTTNTKMNPQANLLPLVNKMLLVD